MSKYKVSVVIPNWNGKEKLEKNLPSILNLKNIEEVIIVDDFSRDESVSFIKENFPQVKLIEKRKNSGFSSTVNIGVAEAQGELVFLLNSDVFIEDQNCLDFIFPHFEDPKVFSVGCNSGGSWSWVSFRDGFIWHYVADGTKKTSHQTLWVSGGSGVFRKDIWDKLGGLDSLFNPFYEEDVDLGYRATKRGYINIWETKSKVEHYKGKGVISLNFSSDFVSRIAQRNQLIFIWKNLTDRKMLKAHINSVFKKAVFHPRYAFVVFSALFNLPQILKKRKLESKEAKLSDHEILEKYS